MKYLRSVWAKYKENMLGAWEDLASSENVADLFTVASLSILVLIGLCTPVLVLASLFIAVFGWA